MFCISESMISVTFVFAHMNSKGHDNDSHKVCGEEKLDG
jgi:hypothetical protein